MKPIDINTLTEFLFESNAIEGEYLPEALEDALTAWGYGHTAIQHNNGRIGLSDILVMHGMIMKRLKPSIAGVLRNVDVKVGGRHCPKPFKVKALMDNWCYHYNETPVSNLGEEYDIKNYHIKFEKIHPFVDGNGRVGRIVMNLQRVYNDLPLLVIHTGEEQEEYYKWFK